MATRTAVRSIIAKCLGALWILDGFLQFQPPMFTSDFVTDVLVPNLSDQPAWLHAIVLWGMAAWNLNPPLNDLGAGLLQICIGVLLLFPLSDVKFKIGAWISIAWGLIVWFCGEGMGSLLTGTATLYTGAPGAVILYVALAALLLAPEKVSLKQFPKIAGWLFIFGAFLQLQSAFWTIDGVQDAAMAAMMEPVRALNAFPIYISNILGLNPALSNVILLCIPVVVGVLLLWKPNYTTGIVAFVFLLLIWWVGQDFGMLSTFPNGVATDPEAAPLMMLFILPLSYGFRKKSEIAI